MSAPTQGAMHLHLDDYPHTLTLLAMLSPAAVVTAINPTNTVPGLIGCC